jgi:hypothetical protein
MLTPSNYRIPVALSIQASQLVVSITHIADIQRRRVRIPSCTFGGQQAQTAVFKGMTVTKGRAVSSIGEKSRFSLINLGFRRTNGASLC